jgi:protein-S-isoprenylcysteine O-methyltransferase Ste14
MQDKDRLAVIRELIFYALGIALILGFVSLYWTRFTFMPSMPSVITDLFYEYGAAWTIAINAGVFVLFLVFLPYRKKIAWRSKGAFAAFILALMAEMFGVPLMIYILSPFVQISGTLQIRDMPPIFWPNRLSLLGWPGMVLGTWMTLAGMGMVIWGWKQIHRANGLVTSGLYAYMRHPQYTGLFLIIIGWIFHWATLLTLIMCPILLATYVLLARKEESELEKEFGAEYETYRQNVGMFLPFRHK